MHSTRFTQAIQEYGTPLVSNINGFTNALPDQFFEASGFGSNTAILSVAAYENSTYQKIDTFIRSARKFQIPLKWLSFREQWKGFTYHKIQQFLRQASYLQAQGITHTFILDSADIVFTDNFPTIIQKALDIYKPGTVLFNRELDNHIYPYQNAEYKSWILAEGKHLNAGALFGSISAIKELFIRVIEIQRELMADQPRQGVAEYCMRDPMFYGQLHQWINDDQLLLQLASLYYPNLIETDDKRYLFAWTQEHDEPLAKMREYGNVSGKPNNASILHSSVTVKYAGVAYWAKWCKENNLI